jgi:N-acyl homoserine lactone hydrolase
MTRLIRSFLALCAIAALTSCSGGDLSSPRIYIFDNGMISGLDPALFNFSPDELASVDLVNISYLVVHPDGTLMFDSGAVPDSAFEESAGGLVTEGVMSATMPLRPQIEAAGYRPEDIDFFAMSHYHSDHTANANMFANSTWIVQRAEYDWMMAEEPEGIINAGSYSALRDADKIILNNEDHDVFGDGTVVIMTTPGHTPGHQVVAVALEDYGPVILGGDLYHYPEEITTGRIPTFEWNADASRSSRARVQSFMEQTGSTLWIEHDMPTHAALPKSPDYVD